MAETQTLENEKKVPEPPFGWKKNAVSLTGMTLFSLGVLLGFFGGWFIGRMQSNQPLVPSPVETPMPDILIPYASPSPIIIGPTEPGDIPSVPPSGIDAVCTMDAMECPDGSYVGRQPPSCQFAPCPGTSPGTGSSNSSGAVSSPSFDTPVSTTMPRSR